MRICTFVSNDLVNEPRVTRHADTLGRFGHTVLVICTKSERTSCSEERGSYSIRRPWLLKRGPAQTSFLRLLSSFVFMTLHFVKLGRDFNAHVYVSNDLDTLLVGVLCAGASRRLIYDAHELYPDQFVGMETVPSIMIAVFRIMESVLLKRVDTVITVNEFISAELEKRYDIRKPEVVLNVPKKQQSIQAPRSGRHGHKIALYHGGYQRTRGLENVVRACGFLLSDITLILRGYGEIETELREIAKAFGNCRFEDPVPPSQLVWRASSADVGLVPYVPVNMNNYFASPNKLFEYIQAGLPVVASDLPFLRKIVIENRIGYLFDPRNPKSIADAINIATRDENLQVMKANVERIQDQYSWDQEQKKLLTIIMEESGRKRRVHYFTNSTRRRGATEEPQGLEGSVKDTYNPA